MNIIITAKMGNGTIQAKLEPLSRIEKVQNIYFLRKTTGPSIPKVRYLNLPSACRFPFFNIILTPLLLTYYVIRFKCSFIISYHIIPYAFFAAFASSISRKPYFVCQTGLLIQKKAKNRLFWLFLKTVILRSQRFCVPGTTSFQFWRTKGIPSSKLKIHHSTVNTDFFKPGNLLESIKYDFIYTGHFGPEKRIDLILTAFSSVINIHKNASFLFVGDGPLIEQMKKIAIDLNLENNVSFIGFQRNVISWIQKARFIVMASDTEGLPCSIMEGMSAGLIPIATNVGNISDVVKNLENGYLIPKGDVRYLSFVMIKVLEESQDLLDNYRMNSRQVIVKNHSHRSSEIKWKTLLSNFIQ